MPRYPVPDVPDVAVLSFRLGVADGVSVAAEQWAAGLRDLGCRVRTVAGDGVADRLVPGLALDAARPPAPAELDAALRGAHLVVVENVCSLPINPPVTAAVAAALRGRSAVLRHHDLPWERERFALAAAGWPPHDERWQHVAISDRAARELARRGTPAVAVRHGYAAVPAAGDRARARRGLGLAPDTRLLLQPTRAIARKGVPDGLALAAALGATYWLTGPAEEGYAPVLADLLAAARTPVLRGLPAGLAMADAYAAADAVVLPSSWEGFGMPLVESAFARRPLAVSGYPVAREVARLGFDWFPVTDPGPLAAELAHPDPARLDRNERLAHRHFGPAALRARLAAVLRRAGLPTPAEPQGVATG